MQIICDTTVMKTITMSVYNTSSSSGTILWVPSSVMRTAACFIGHTRNWLLQKKTNNSHLRWQYKQTLLLLSAEEKEQKNIHFATSKQDKYQSRHNSNIKAGWATRRVNALVTDTHSSIHNDISQYQTYILVQRKEGKIKCCRSIKMNTCRNKFIHYIHNLKI